MKNVIRYINEFLHKCYSFGLKWSLTFLACKIFKTKKFYLVFSDACAEYLEKQYGYLYEKFNNTNHSTTTTPLYSVDNSPIYIFWAQGEKQMPPVVRACYESIKRHCAKHPIVLIDINNIQQFANIPDYFWQKMNKGIFTIQCLADLLRQALLSERGGIWCDATIYLTDTPKEFIHFDGEYFMMKAGDNLRGQRPAWCDHLMIGQKGNLINTYLYEAHLDYYKKENVLLEYGIMWNLACNAYKNIPHVKEILDSIPVNNVNKYYLKEHYSKKYDAVEVEKVKKDTCIFKLDWRMQNIDDPNSIYQYLISGKI